MRDCPHKTLKCAKCMRFVQGDPDTPPKRDDRGYLPPSVDFEPDFNRVHVEKGPFLVTIIYNEEGIIVDVWDRTDDDADCPTNTMCEFFDDCVEPDRTDLIANPDQIVLPLPEVKPEYHTVEAILKAQQAGILDEIECLEEIRKLSEKLQENENG